MAETGVTESSSSGDGKRGSFFKRNKTLVLAGGGLGALFLFAHKGSSSGSAGSNSGSAVTAGELGAYQQGIQDAASLSGLSTGNAASSGSTSSGGTSGGGGGTTETVNISGGQIGTGKGDKFSQSNKGPGKASTVNHHHPKKHHPKPKEPPHNTRGHRTGKHGKPIATTRHTASGHKKNSPVEVEAMSGAGSGIVVMGKHFPGAVSHHLGAPRRVPGGTVRDVTINYGGHSETHTVANNGDRWEMFTRGKNPPRARGTLQLVSGGGVH